MRARSAVFDLYGDHLASRAGWAPVAAVVALTSECGIAGPATRTAVHRMVTQGWLEQRVVGGQRGYAATAAATARLDRAHARIYAMGPPDWDRCWHVVVPHLPPSRSVRDRAHGALTYLGYGRLGKDAWVSPWRSPEVPDVLDGLDVAYTDVHGPSASAPHTLATQVWDLRDLGEQYRDFRQRIPAPDDVADLAPEEAYRQRTDLVHRWRTFLFLDPGLPAGALPDAWPGHAARADFLAAAAALAPAASRFVDLALTSAGDRDRQGAS